MRSGARVRRGLPARVPAYTAWKTRCRPGRSGSACSPPKRCRGVVAGRQRESRAAERYPFARHRLPAGRDPGRRPGERLVVPRGQGPARPLAAEVLNSRAARNRLQGPAEPPRAGNGVAPRTRRSRPTRVTEWSLPKSATLHMPRTVAYYLEMSPKTPTGLRGASSSRRKMDGRL